MKFKDVKTLESILLEYGMKPGSSTSVSQQQTGANAKANKIKSPTTSNTPKKADQGSPTVGDKNVPEPVEPKQQSAKSVKKDAVIVGKDNKNKKVVSPVGDGNLPDAMVVQDEDGEYEIIDQNEKVDALDPDDVEQMANEPSMMQKSKSGFAAGAGAVDKIANLMASADPELGEGKIQKRIRKKALNKLKPKIAKEKGKVKRLARLGLQEAPEKLFEINFNRKEVIKNSLEAPIRCGWEAETIWTDLEEGGTDDVDNMTLSQIDDEFGGVDWDSLSDGYTDWIYEYKQEEFMEDMVDDFINQHEDDEDYINEFIDDEGIEESDWDDYREGVLRTEYGDERYEEEGPEELSELYGYEDENWAREYVDEYRGGDFRDYLRSIAEDDDDVKEAAYQEASENYDYDDWINDQWYSMSSFCDDYGIDYTTSGSMSEVADIMEGWISDESAFHDHMPEYGDYGNTSGNTTEYAVESDSSIDGYGLGAEIISPVFSKPENMLKEMKKFFKFLERNSVDTNSSTGLHITMTYNPDPDAPTGDDGRQSVAKANRVKMAVLLGDKYLLSEFNRDRNTYTKSQMEELEFAVKKLQKEPGQKDSIKVAEEFLEKYISDDKFRAIHFKSQRDSKNNAKLIEFRIAGGEDYHLDFQKVFKSVVRYATTMIAGHTDEYDKEYARALYRLLNKATKLQSRDVEEVENLKTRFDDISGHPIVDTSKAIISSDRYLDFTSMLLTSMDTLKDAVDMETPERNEKWRKSWLEYIKNTNDSLDNYDSSLRRSLNDVKSKLKEEEDIIDKVNRVRSGGSIKAYFRPEIKAPIDQAKEFRKEGMAKFSHALSMLAIDVETGKARSKPNAKSIGALRNFLKISNISDKELNAQLKVTVPEVNFVGTDRNGRSGDDTLTPQQKFGIIKNGLNKLLQKDIVVAQKYISAPEIEALTKGLWNAFNSEKFNDKVFREIHKMVIAHKLGDSAEYVESDRVERNMFDLLEELKSKREFNDFYNKITPGPSRNLESGRYLSNPGEAYTPKAFKKLISYLKQFENYNHPVTRAHNPNLYSDDSYEENFLSKYTMLLRRRFQWLEKLYDTDKTKAIKVLKLFVPLIEKFLKSNLSQDGERLSDIFGIELSDITEYEWGRGPDRNFNTEQKEEFYDLMSSRDGKRYLGIERYQGEQIQSVLDVIVAGDEIERRTISMISGFTTESIRDALSYYFSNKKSNPGHYQKDFEEIQQLIKSRFEGIRDFMRGVDKIYSANGFSSQDDAIARKQTIDKDARKFAKNTRQEALSTLTVHPHSMIFVKNDSLEFLQDVDPNTDLSSSGQRTLRDIINASTRVNGDHKIFFVIPWAHYGPVKDAVDNMDRLGIQAQGGNHSQDWRLENYRKLLQEFIDVYGVRARKFIREEGFTNIGYSDLKELAGRWRIDVEQSNYDGRSGQGNFEDLLPADQLKNQYSGEPLDSNSAISWSMNNDADKKIMNAYDFNKYHGKEADKIKKLVLQQMANNTGFYVALRKVLEKVQPTGLEGIDADGIRRAAGVDEPRYSGDATATIMDETNWSNLTDYLKIERGVNDQGINLLKKIAEDYSSSQDEAFDYMQNGERQTMYSMERFIKSILLAKQYIVANYNVSGGNYFRKNPDGSDGDDVSSVYSSEPRRRQQDGSQIDDNDYADMREKYDMFNGMMQNGMQLYMVQSDVNRLVDFLKNPQNDEDFKNEVLMALASNQENGGAPVPDLQTALRMGRNRMGEDAQEARVRMLGRESVFDKFDQLPLEEQLRIVTESTVLEKWSKKYKDSINCSNPKGFSQKAHCAGKKKANEGDVIKTKFATKQAQKGKDKYKKVDVDIPVHASGDDYDEFILYSKDNKIGKIIGKHEDEYYELGTAPYELASVLVDMYNRGGFTDKDIKQLDPKDVFERPLTKDEKKDKEKYVKGMKKSKGDFEKRYGKDAKAVMYATATKMAKESLWEGVPKVNTVKILNDLLADHFPVSDLKKQMLAFQAIPIPQMLNQFRELRAEAGDDACARGIVRYYTNALPKSQRDQIDLNEWAKNRVKSLIESKGIMGRVLGDTFLKGDDRLEFQSVNLYPSDEMEFDSPEQRDDFIQQLEQELNSQIEWTNVPNKGSLAFGVAVLTDPALDDKITYWGRYFKQKTADMMGKWGNSQVPQGWKLQTAGAMKLDIGIDPQHLIKTDDPFNGVLDVIQAVKTNSADNELSETLVNALETIHTQEHPVFPGQISNLPALRDYFGEIMGPVALMSDMVGGQAEDARRDLLRGIPWSNCTIFWPMAMNAPLVDSYFTAPDGTRVGISSKGGKGAKASVKNIQDAIEKASPELKAQFPTTVNVINIVQSNSAKDGPFRLAELYRILPQGLEEEINGYIQEGKQDYAGLSPACTELFNYGTPRQDVPGFNTGYAMLALLAKKVTKAINESGPEFGQGCVAFLNQSSIVQLYCKMGKQGDDARVTGWEAVYPPNFQGTVEIDGSKNYYSSRIGGKFAFGFK